MRAQTKYDFNEQLSEEEGRKNKRKRLSNDCVNARACSPHPQVPRRRHFPPEFLHINSPAVRRVRDSLRVRECSVAIAA